MDLVDIGILLWHRRRLMSFVFTICALLSVAAAVMDTPIYNYTTTMQLGTAISPTTGDVTPLMAAQDVVKVMNDSYIPRAIYQFLAEGGAKASASRIPLIQADGDRDGTHVILSCVSTEERSSVCTAVEKLAANSFIEDNSRFITAQNNALQALRSKAGVLHVQMDKLDASEAIYRKQAADLEKQIERIKSTSVNAAKEATNGTSALSNLILDTQVQDSLNSLTVVRQQLEVTIPQTRAQIISDLDSNTREQQLREQQLSQSVTHVQDAGLRSYRPVGFGRVPMFVFGVALSLLTAAIAGFFANYIDLIRGRLASQSKG